MLREIRKLYQYHDWANRQVLDAANTLAASELEIDIGGSFRTFNKTLQHIVLVELLFMDRWQGLPSRPRPEWESLDQIRTIWSALEKERHEYLNRLKETRVTELIHYRDTRGRTISLELWQALFHCINHSTFHRGQLIEKFRKLGRIPPSTDLVLLWNAGDGL